MINIDSLVDGIDFRSKMLRARFEELNGNLFKSTVETVEKALNVAGIRKCDIQEVVLVGGSTRIPMVQRLLQGFFGGKQLKKTVNPDGSGGTQAAKLDGKPENTSERIKSLELIDVTPLSLGICIGEGLMSVIIPRNTT